MTEEPTQEQDGRPGGREYRIGELAEAAGVPVRTPRYYQERRLLPPPRREGRIGLYSGEHLARLRVIGDLLARGHTLEGVRELLSAWEQGRDIETVLGVEKAVTAPWSNEVPVTMTMDELAAVFVRLFVTHVVDRLEDGDLGEPTGMLERLRPDVRVTVEAAFARAMDRQVRAAVDRYLGDLAAPADPD